MPIERSLIGLVILAAIVVVGLQFNPKARKPAAVGATTPYTFSTEIGDALSQLRHNKHADIFRGLDANAQELLIGLVREHCSRKFEEQSCLHYAISCGRPCMAYLHKAERSRMLASFEKLNPRGNFR